VETIIDEAVPEKSSDQNEAEEIGGVFQISLK